MLSKNAIRHASNVGASLESAVLITPIEGSPVDQVVTETVIGSTGLVAPTVDEKLYQGSMQANPMGVVTHDVVSEEAVELIAPAIGAHFQFARHVVNPAIRQIVAAISDVVGQRAPLHNLSQYSLSQVHGSPMTDDLINRYAGSPLQPVVLFGHFPDMSEAELMELLKTGSSSLDSDILDMVSARPTGWLNDVYLRYFRQNDEFNQTREIDRADELLVVHLWCLKFDNNPPAQTSMSLAEYNQRITALQAQSGNALVDIYRRWDRLVTNGTLVWKFPPTSQVLASDKDGAVVVVGPVYQRFVSEGGSPEVVFGSAVSDRAANVADLLSKREQYLTEYNRFVDRQVNYRNSSIGKTARSELANLVSKLILDPASGLPEGCDVAAIQKLAAEKIALIKDHELIEDTYRQVRWVLGTSVYVHTNALEILETIDAVIEQKPDLAPGRAATNAAIRLVVKYLLSQVSIRRQPQ